MERTSVRGAGDLRAHRYLGDAVYAGLDEWGSVVLYTSDGYAATNRIVLDGVVLDQLELWVAELREEAKR